jgi:hypothetical protein
MENPKTRDAGIPKPERKGGWVQKCDLDSWLGRNLPIPTQVVSNEEFFPMAQTRRQGAVERRLVEMSDVNARKLGLPAPVSAHLVRDGDSVRRDECRLRRILQG